jgi:hypothetical protein
VYTLFATTGSIGLFRRFGDRDEPSAHCGPNRPQLATPLSWENPLDRWLCVFVFRRICLFQSAGILLTKNRSRKLSPMSDLHRVIRERREEKLAIDLFFGDE